MWRAVLAEPHSELPDARITLRDALDVRAIRRIYAAARRTLHTREDLLPHFDKLVHPTGVCLRGHWRITETTPYTGLFRTGTQALVIARASENMGETRPGRLRFLGLAGKLYPTCDPAHEEPLPTANFVMNENLLGSHTPYFAHATFSTDLLPFTWDTAPTLKLVLGAIVASIFAVADRVTSVTQSFRRQLYPLAEAGERSLEQARAPSVMLLVGAPENRKVDTPDFREELNIAHHPDGIRFEIHVSDRRHSFARRGFRRIGEVLFTGSVTSSGCDHRLHFPHPEYRT